MTKIKELPKNDLLDERTFSHESFGLVQFSRFSSNDKTYFGEEPILGDGISLSIKHGLAHIDKYGVARYSDARIPIVEVKMTNAQFAELISTMNIGDGVPCTIQTINGKRIESASLSEVKQDDDELILNQVDNSKEEVDNYMKKISEILQKKSIGVGDRKDILSYLGYIVNRSKTNLDFTGKVLQEKNVEVKQKLIQQISYFIHSSGANLEISPSGNVKVLEE